MPELRHYLHAYRASGADGERDGVNIRDGDGRSAQRDSTPVARGAWHVELHVRIDDALCCAPCEP